MSPVFPLCLDGAGRRVAERWVWRGLDWRIEGGSRWAVRGPSGSGKSLLLRALCGLDALDAGTVSAGGRELSAWAGPVFRSRVRYVAQRPALFAGTVRENVAAASGLAVHGGREPDATAAEQALERVGRSARLLERTTPDLSGGEQQLVALLRALQGEPAVLLLDEPTASLDAEATDAVEVLVKDWLAGEARRAVVWTTHDAAQVARVADATLDVTAFAP